MAKLGSAVLGIMAAWLMGALTVAGLMILALIASAILLFLAFVYDWNMFWSLVPPVAVWLVAWLLDLFGFAVDVRLLKNKTRQKTRSEPDES